MLFADLLRALSCSAQDRLDALIDIFICRRPVTYADPHGSAAFPNSPSAPADAVLLNRCDRAQSLFRIAEGDQDLVQHHFIEHFKPSGPQSVCESACLPAIALDEFGKALAADRSQSRVVAKPSSRKAETAPYSEHVV